MQYTSIVQGGVEVASLNTKPHRKRVASFNMLPHRNGVVGCNIMQYYSSGGGGNLQCAPTLQGVEGTPTHCKGHWLGVSLNTSPHYKEAVGGGIVQYATTQGGLGIDSLQ